MKLEPMEYAHHPGGLVHLLSAPEGSLFWAAGMRHEIQSRAGEPEADRDYVAHCLNLLLRSEGWRMLLNARGGPFRSFIQFCQAGRPHGLGLTRDEVEWFLLD